MNKANQRGFTLVEIAIVLVIIGLMLGGILKGQELINSARVRSLADQNAGVQAAYYGFIDRYRRIPGDMRATDAADDISSTITAGGDGDGVLDADDYEEASAAWNHLSVAGFINGNYVGGAEAADTYQVADKAPTNPFSNYIMLTRSLNYLGAGLAATRLVLFTGHQIPANVLRELDTKVDDGRPDTGTLRAANGDAITPQYNDDENCQKEGPGGVATTVWDVDKSTQDCGAVFLY
jgi:prepilin-type N-terminal cleavage/methylation domain-containing protein